MRSERWQARSDTPINKGESVRVTARDGLVLRVKPQAKAEE
ncbi:MAG: NfeD family protein [Halofilum sp. (in: g-proteobacteria)]|nr:NfeD family protein [Halofilum sp. (in: g-proteobacteria)]